MTLNLSYPTVDSDWKAQSYAHLMVFNKNDHQAKMAT